MIKTKNKKKSRGKKKLLYPKEKKNLNLFSGRALAYGERGAVARVRPQAAAVFG